MIEKYRPESARVTWGLLVSLLLCAFAWACSQPAPLSDRDDPDEEVAPTDPPAGSGGKNAGGNTQDSGGTEGGNTQGGGPTPASVRVAFIGDTSTGADFKSVLQLVKAEGANALMIQGDLTYSGDTANGWLSAIDNEINKDWPGSKATVTIPYFASRGNHDSDWKTLGAGLKARMEKWGITPENGDPTTENYAVVYKGLEMVMVTEHETSPTRAEYIKERLAGDQAAWKICSWHKNMASTNVGGKSDELNWQMYENCRLAGAIVAQGHSHTYSRSKSITNDTSQTVDSKCSSPFELCVGPGVHFFFDSSLGGNDMRSVNSGQNAKAHWGTTYTGNFGALFIDFNVGGDPKKAQGYFKTTGGTVIDPPASSGKKVFTITRAP